ncbi:MAG: hypothetical protein DME76_13130 [Verrucomicrobia bacterium]|nr:MAG: hypothetical protein DME76_13130 [Verrucomicrobiota bacterium]
MMNRSRFADELLGHFLQHVRALGGDVEPVKVLRSNTYRVGNAHVLARVAADTGKYFFGLNYINAEEVANLDNSFVAFVCGDVGSSVIMPMSELMKLLPQISHDRNGEFKINITKDFELALKGRGNRKPLNEFLNNWDLITSPANTPGEVTSAEQSFHTVLQGRLIEIGNDRGFQTYSPNHSKKFNNVPLGDLTKLDKCPDLQFANYDSLRNIDVIWFREAGKQFYPECAFEVELSTGIWSGVGRLAALREYSTRLL